MWVKKRVARNKITERANMGPIAEYEQKLQKAAAGNDAQSVPNAVVIAADSEGNFSSIVFPYIDL
jgi:hypothetical protein